MTSTEFRPAEPNSIYIGAGVTIKGAITAPGDIVVDGAVEGEVTGRAIRIGPSGSIKGSVRAEEADVHGLLSDKVEVTQLLHVHSTGRIEGNVSCGDVQVDRGGILAGGIFSVKPTADETSKTGLVSPAPERPTLVAAAE
jgi:cytoskeletal protein CcmA (bactofilin family)